MKLSKVIAIKKLLFRELGSLLKEGNFECHNDLTIYTGER